MPENCEIPSHTFAGDDQDGTSGLPSANPTLPFWMMDPDKFLTGHRTTSRLPKYADRVIIGSGITGASAAWYWTERDTQDSNRDFDGIESRVLMLEAREACSGATGRNGGHLQPLLTATTPDIALFEQFNCKEVAEIIEWESIPCEYRSLSSCHTLWTEKLGHEGHKSYLRLAKDAPKIAEAVKWIDTEEEFKDAEVHIGVKGGTITQGAASLWPYKYVAFLLKKMILGSKLNLQTNEPVTSIREIGEQERSQIDSDLVRLKARYALVTGRGIVYARNVLLATNAYTSQLLPEFKQLIVPIRETMTAQLPPPAFSEKQLKHSHGFMGFGISNNPRSTEYLNQRPFVTYPGSQIKGSGHLMLGGARIAAASLPHVGVSDDSIVDKSVVTYLQHVLPKALRMGDSVPEELELEKAWSGIWAQSRDEAPWVGPVPGHPKGLWLCAAYSGHGMPNATLCAKAIVTMIEERDVQGEVEEEPTKSLIVKVELPQSYFITPDRLARAAQYPTVHEMDRLGLEPQEWLHGERHI